MADETPSGVFISYSRQSRDFVDKLEADLNARSFDPWVDRRRLTPGESWPDAIKRQIQLHEKMIIVITYAALQSDWVRNEYEYALLLKRPIIPVLLEPVPVAEWPIQFVSLQYADFQKSYESGLTELLRSLALPGQQLHARPSVGANVQEDEAPTTDSEGQLNFRELYRLGTQARARGDLERAAILWEQIVEKEPNYLKGTVKTELKQIEPQLRPMRIQRLRQEAQESWRAGQWEREIAAWQALLRLDPEDAQAREELPIAQNNREYADLYDVICDLWKEHDVQAIPHQFELLWKSAPYYGDPDGIAPQVGLNPRMPRWEVRKQEEAEAAAKAERDRIEAQARAERNRLVAQEKAERDRIAAQEQAERERKEAEEEAKRKQIAAQEQAERERKEAEEEAKRKREEERKARRPRYRKERLKTSHASLWVFAVGFIATMTTLIYTLGPDLMGNYSLDLLAVTVLNTRQNFVSVLVQSRLPAIFLTLVVAVSVLAFALGYRRALHPFVMATAAVAGGTFAAGILVLVYRVNLASPELRFYSFPFTGTARIPSGAPWGFAIACGIGYLLPGIILGMIFGIVSGLYDEDLEEGLGVGFGIAICGPIYGFLFGVGLGFLGWLGTGLVIGTILGVLVGLIDIPAEDDLEPGLVTLFGGLIVVVALGFSSWFVVGLFLKLDSALILYFLGGIAASAVAGVSLAATIKIWLTRAQAAKSESR